MLKRYVTVPQPQSLVIMKFASVIVALIAATMAVAAPTSFEARDITPSVELNDVDVAAINYLAARGLFDETSLEARGLFDKLKGKKQSLKITFHDPTGPVSAATQKQITKELTKFIDKAHQKTFPFCDVKYAFPYACGATVLVLTAVPFQHQ